MATEKNLFTPAEICTIIETSGKAKVSRLKFGDFEVEFGAQPESPVQSQPSWLERTPVPHAPAPLASATAQTPLINLRDRKPEPEDELRFREDQLALMRIEDPFAYEQLLQLKGELVDDGSIDDDDGAGGDQGA